MVVEITPVSIGNIGYKTYIYFSVFNFCFLPLIYFFYPEARYLSLEQIDRLFTGPKVLMHWDSSMGAMEGAFQAEDPETGGGGGELEKPGHTESVEHKL